MKMLHFEIKKIFSRFKNRLAVMLLLLLMAMTCIFTILRVEYLDENGNRTTGISAAKSLREEKNKWAGYLTEDALSEIVRENRAINNSRGASSEDMQEWSKADVRRQGISGIAQVINSAYSEWRDYNYYAIDSLSEEEAGLVYEKRISNLKKWLASGEERFSDAQKDFLIRQYESLETPFYYEYVDGWGALLQNISTFILILALVIGFLVSGVFSDEFQTKADSIFFSTELGRNKAVVSKMAAGFLIITCFYIFFIAAYTFIVLTVLGADGANCPIQLELWRSVYNITFFQAYLFITIGGYVGTLLAAILSMLVSAAARSTATAAIVPFILLCAFPFLSRIVTLPGICSFFPDQLLEIYLDIKDFSLVELGGRVMTVAEVIVPVYAVMCVVFLPIIYGVYKRAEVR